MIAKRTKTPTWTPVWRVANEGTHVVAYEARKRRSGEIAVRRLIDGDERDEPVWLFALYYDATAEAIERFLAQQTQLKADLTKTMLLLFGGQVAVFATIVGMLKVLG